MKILRIIASMDPQSGGPCQGIRNIVPALGAMGVVNEVVSLDAPDASFLGKDDFFIYPLGPATNAWSYGNKLYPWLIENLCRFDAVIVHGLWLYHGYACRKAIQKLRKESKGVPKLYVMPHGMLDPYFQKAPERRFKAIRNWLYWKLIEQKLIHQADALLFTCEQEMLLARETFIPYHPAMEVNVGYGILPPPEYNPYMQQTFLLKCAGLQGKPYLLFLSRIHEKKGVDLLVKAYIQLVKENKSTNMPHLVIAGPGIESSFGKAVQETVAKEAMVRDLIHFPGMLSGDAKWGAFYGCEAFVLPSHQENFGIAVVEALACGKAVLISDQINIWKEIIGQKAGLVANDTMSGVYILLEDWLNLSQDNRYFMESNSKKLYENKFNIQVTSKTFLSHIRK